MKERAGPSCSHILCSFVFFDVVEHTKVVFAFFFCFVFFLTATRRIASLQSAVKVGIDAFT